MSSSGMIPGFVTDSGIQIPAVTAAQMREIDRVALEETGPNLVQMMENAGRSLAELALEHIAVSPQTASVLVLAGSGGNGGGGICAARHLAARVADVALCLADADSLGDVPRQQLGIFEHTRGRRVGRAEIEALQPTLILDALIGYGLRQAPRGTVAELIAWTLACVAPTISLDLPSGVDATTGHSPGLAVRPAATLTLALPKTGLALADAGDLYLADLGIPETAYRRAGIAYLPPFDARFVVPGARAWSLTSAQRRSRPAAVRRVRNHRALGLVLSSSSCRIFVCCSAIVWTSDVKV